MVSGTQIEKGQLRQKTSA